MDRLALYIALLGGTAIAGALITTVFALGYYAPWIIAACALAGFAMAWPTGYLTSAMIKRNDPAWDDDHDRPKPPRG